MKPDELEALGIRIHGKRWGWQTAIAARLKITRSTMNRYMSGEMPIPGPVEAAVRCWAGQL